MIRRLAVIPARGGSKRLPRKNIHEFCGKPMIGHILDTAKSSKLFETIHVSTEDEEIYKISSDLGFSPDFKRPDRLADDITPIVPVLKYVTEQYLKMGTSFDQVWLLMACAPLITSDDLKGAAALFEKHNGLNPVLAITEYAAPIEWAFDRDDQGRLTPLQPGMFSTPSNNIKPKYHDTGTFLVFSADSVLSSVGAGSDHGYIGAPISRESGIDIDSSDDWRLAEAVYRYRNSNNPNGFEGK